MASQNPPPVADDVQTALGKLLALQAPADMPDLLYHYTDAAGLAGMIQSGEIWMTDCRFCNDRYEVDAAMDNLVEQVSEVIKETNQVAAAAFDTACRKAREETLCCILSLSARRDQLSQWRAYADDGMGFCVGFSLPRNKPGLLLQECTYMPVGGVVEPVALPTNAASLYATVVQAVLAASRGGPTRKATELTALMLGTQHLLMTTLFREAIRRKNHHFFEEKEWRLIATVARRPAPKDFRIGVRQRAGLLVPYAAYTGFLKQAASGPGGTGPRQSGALPIREILIGPRQNRKQAERALRVLLETNGYDPAKINIEHFDCGYR